jgi:hypothetical protein
MVSLDSVKQKIVWAHKHLKALEDESLRYFSLNPGEVVTEEEPHSGRIRLRFKEKISVPPEIPLIIGDVVQNLRSSLDYLVWELVLAAKNQPSEKNMFPICDTLEAFDEQLKRHRLDGVPPEAIGEIKALQPYHYGQKVETAPIRALETFASINKHRRILLTVLATLHSKTEFIGTQSGHSVQSTLTPRYDGAEIAIGPEPILGDKMEVKGKTFIFITFNERPAEGIEVSTCLIQLWKFVEDFVFPKFTRFF